MTTATTLPALGGGTRAIDLILWETAQARYLEQSAPLAGFVEQALRARVEMSPRAVQQAPFRVLVGANMPAALVEIGYLSNPEQENAAAPRRRIRTRSRRRCSTRSSSSASSLSIEPPTAADDQPSTSLMAVAIALVAGRRRSAGR